MKKLDLTAFSVMLITALLLIVVVYVGDHVPIQITCQLPASCSQIGPFGSLTFEFSRPVQAERVEALWQVTPQVEGKWEWADNQHARWSSLKPLPADQPITFQFAAGQVGQNGEPINGKNQWQATVRTPRIIAIQNASGGRELFSFGLDDGQAATQLTHSTGDLYDYQASPDGESVVFSVVNDKKGIDLWIVQRDGSNQHKLLDCGVDHCTTPAWSPVSQELAYTRESAGLDPNGPVGAPRIYIFDFSSGQTSPLFSDAQKIGYGPRWSPDGQWLSIWVGSEGSIEVVNRKSGDTFMLESASGDVGSWSADSQYLYYSNMVVGANSMHNVVLKADVSTQTYSTILGADFIKGDYSVDNPVCSPTDGWVAITVQPDIKKVDRTLFLLNPNAKDGIALMDQASRIPGYYAWSPDGNLLVYEVDYLGDSSNKAEIWAWDRTKGKSLKITDSATSPEWLP
jgi:Tol biopolymer transport system component